MGTSRRILLYFLTLAFSIIPMSFSACTRGFLAAGDEDLLSFASSDQLQTYLQGKTLYDNNCAQCHGSLETSSKRNRSADQIKAATLQVGQMSKFQSLALGDLMRISYALNNSMPTTGSSPTRGPIANTTLRCDPNGDPGVTPIRRLTKEEYINTLMTLFHDSDLLGRQDRAYENYEPIGLLAPLLGAMPDDSRSNVFSRLDSNVSGNLLEGQFLIAETLAKAVAESSKLRNYAGDCSLTTAPDAACVTNFINSFGKRVFRRPLKSDETSDLKTTYDTYAASGPQFGFEAVIESMLLSPQFLFLVETEGTPVNGRTDLLKISDYELASRLSYAFTANMPSDELMAAADSGKLSTDPAFYNDQINKLLADNPSNNSYGVYSRTHPLLMSPLQRNLMKFYNEWLNFDSVPELVGTKAMDAFRNVYNNSQFVWNDSMNNAKKETIDFVFRLTFLENKKYADLLTDDSAVLISSSATNYYLLPSNTPTDQIVKLPNRAGILTRVPFMTSGNELTSPIRRGVFIRRRLLCDNLPSPNPDALPDRSLNSPDADPSMTTRDRFAAKTSSSTCMTCHSQINPLGFALEDFDSLGRNRSQLFEPIFKVDGDNVTLINKLQVNASVSNIGFSPNDGLNVNGGIDLSHKLAESEKSNTCFVRQMYRYTLAHYEDAGDDCLMKSMYDAMNQDGGSIMSLLKAMPNHPNFKLKKIGN